MDTCRSVIMGGDVSAVMHALEQLPGLAIVTTCDDGDRSSAGDRAIVEIRSHHGVDRYVAQYQPRVTTTTLGSVTNRLERARHDLGLRPLLLTDHVTPAVAAALHDQQIAFADAAGNAHLDGAAGYVHVLGRRPERRPARSGLTTTDLELTYALLRHPALLREPLRAIAQATGISLGKVSEALRTLIDQGYVGRRKGNLRVLHEPARLLERWEFGYLEQLRPRLNPTTWRLGPSDTLEHAYQQGCDLDEVRIGGEYAADAYTRHLKPATLTLHVPPGTSRRTATLLQLRPTQTPGDVTLIERLRPPLDALPANASPPSPPPRQFAHPILVRAELLALGSDRLNDVADRLLERVIMPALRHGG